MGLATFKGGIHPYEGKELSENKPIQVLLPKGELVFPMSQHIGAPAKPLVAKGDRVLAGQKIGEAGGFISANVICSVSGTVKAIEPRRMVNGAMVPSIIVENDGEYETVEGVGEDRDPSTLSKEEIRSIVKEAPDGRIQHPMLHVHHERQIVFSPVADYRKRALHHIPFLQIFSVEAVKNFCIGAGKLIRHTFHPKMVRDHGSLYIAFRRRKNVKRALIYCPL